MTIHTIANGLGNQHAGEVIITGRDLLLGTSPPTEQVQGNWATYEYGIGDDSVIGEIPVPRQWARGTLINVWVRYMIDEAFALGNGQVKFQVDYESVLADGSQALGAGAIGVLTGADTNIPAVALSPIGYYVGVIPAADLAWNDSLGVTISRIALTGGGANPVAEPGIMDVRFTIATDNLVPQRQ
jgi:hypothetical protein